MGTALRKAIVLNGYNAKDCFPKSLSELLLLFLMDSYLLHRPLRPESPENSAARQKIQAECADQGEDLRQMRTDEGPS